MPKKLIDLDLLSRFKEKLDTELETKANVDGNYPTLTSGLADNLTPYSEDSGAEQTKPFISNGTGTNNNTEIVTVGDYGLFKSKNGNTLVVNQYVSNDLALEKTYNTAGTWDNNSYTRNGLTFTNNGDGSYTVNGIATDNTNFSLVRTTGNIFPTGHKIMVLGQTNDSQCYLGMANNYSGVGEYCGYNQSLITQPQTPDGYYSYLRITVLLGTQLTNKKITPKLIDLTKMFNGVIPPDLLDNPSHLSWYYNGSLAYNTGSLENANGVKLVSTGRQLWDGEWELGSLNGIGQEVDSQNIRSKNYIKVIPNTTCYGKCPSGKNLWVYYYDKNKVNIPIGGSAITNTTFVIPSNCEYIRFYMSSGYGTTYNNDITISLYYTPEQGGEGYNKYYAYEQPYVVDTGSEVLRKAGSVYDYKEPNGTIHRLVGVVDLGTLSWSYAGGFFRAQLTGVATFSATSLPNAICSKYLPDTWAHLQSSGYFGISDTGLLGIFDSNYTDATTFKTAMSGVYLYYELATPTTEQGTPFPENLPINDYGMLYWLDENDNLVGIPQGNTIFFPTNYKGFVDDMYSRVDGDSSKFVIDEELSAEETARGNQYTILLNAVSGTLRQLLASSQSIDFLNTAIIDLGDVSWASGTIVSTIAMSGIIKAPTDQYQKAHILCTKYQTSAQGDSAITSKNLQIAFSTGGNLRVYDTSLNGKTATEIQQALKGVLLAYEKA